MLCCVVFCRVVSCRVVSCRVGSCRVVSCRVVSCRVVSCHVALFVCLFVCFTSARHSSAFLRADPRLASVFCCLFAWLPPASLFRADATAILLLIRPRCCGVAAAVVNILELGPSWGIKVRVGASHSYVVTVRCGIYNNSPNKLVCPVLF